MAGTRTLAIIKPDAFGAGNAGKILALLESKGFALRGARVVQLTDERAGAFYAVHRERPFYASLVEFMTSASPLASTEQSSASKAASAPNLKPSFLAASKVAMVGIRS